MIPRMGQDSSGGKAEAEPGGVRPIFWVLLALVVLLGGAAAVVVGLRTLREMKNERAAAAANGRAERTTPVAAIALAPLPVKSPLIERPGTDEFDYPLAYVDRGGLRSLLGRGKHAELTRYVEEFQREFEADFKKEYWVYDVCEAFDSAEPELGVALDAWVKATPTSFAPYRARGTHYFATGTAARGSDWASKTEKVNFELMSARFALARADFNRALSINPRLVAALRQKMRMAFIGADRPTEFVEMAASAFKACPRCM